MSRPKATRQASNSPEAGVSLQLLIPGALAASALFVTASALYTASIVPLFLGMIGLSAAYAIHRQGLSFTQASDAHAGSNFC